MRTIETEYKAQRMTLRSHLGSLAATAAVFLAIASTSLRMGGLAPSTPQEKPVYYLAPPRELVEARSVARQAPETIETFTADSVLDAEPETLQFDPIDVSIDTDISAKVSLDLAMDKSFQARAPQTLDFDTFAIYDRSEVDEPPVVRYAREPEVPLRMRGKEVEVVVFYYVDSKGRTDNQSVLDSSDPDPVYGEMAIEAIRDWRFRPARKNGKPVACWIHQTIKFNQGSTSPFSL